MIFGRVMGKNLCESSYMGKQILVITQSIVDEILHGNFAWNCIYRLTIIYKKSVVQWPMSASYNAYLPIFIITVGIDGKWDGTPLKLWGLRSKNPPKN